jgi:pimeloyl-ACP methyl ester carboxylesterase
MRSVDTRHGELVYFVMGEGAPFILLHGNTMTAATQEKLSRRFADEHQVFSVDLLGHGHSARPRDLFSTRFFRMQGEALADMLDLLFPYEQVPLFGMSAGGVSALNAACEAPQRILALILDSVFVYVGEDTVNAHRKNIDALSEAWHMYLRKQHGDEWWPQLNEGLLATVEQLEASGISVAPCLDNIRIPTMVFQGGRDPFSAEVQGRIIEASIPEARLVYDADAGHIFAWQNPDAFRDMVREFLRSVRNEQ